MNKKKLLDLIKSIYPNKKYISLHEPFFFENGKNYLNQCLKTGYVSSSGSYLEKFNKKIQSVSQNKYVALTSSGTSALHLSLLACEVKKDHEVITQPFTFVATINSILQAGANPVFVDIDLDDMGLSPKKLSIFLKENTYFNKKGDCINKNSKKKIKSIVSCDLLGSVAKQYQINKICKKYNLSYISDSSEALGTKLHNQHTGLHCDLAVISFNGNKIITTGNGGAVFSNKKKLIDKVNFLSSTSKVNHKYEFIHSELGYNYRMSNINAALGYSQIVRFKKILQNKKKIFKIYKNFINETELHIYDYKEGISSNHWLNLLMVKNSYQKKNIINYFIKNNIYVRPAWFPICDLSFCKKFERGDIKNTYDIYNKLICLPSGLSNEI